MDILELINTKTQEEIHILMNDEDFVLSVLIIPDDEIVSLMDNEKFVLSILAITNLKNKVKIFEKIYPSY